MEIQTIKISEEERKLLSDFYGEDVGNEIDFNRLMPVVEKIYLIRTVELEMSIGQLRINCLLHGGFFGSAFCIAEKTGFECWYMSVVEFIKWYNHESKAQTSN